MEADCDDCEADDSSICCLCDIEDICDCSCHDDSQCSESEYETISNKQV